MRLINVTDLTFKGVADLVNLPERQVRLVHGIAKAVVQFVSPDRRGR
jgi:hypothetical protein